MRKYFDKETVKTVIVSHHSIGNTNKIDMVLADTAGDGYKVSLQDFLSERFQEMVEVST
jgi:hypothetical protein